MYGWQVAVLLAAAAVMILLLSRVRGLGSILLIGAVGALIWLAIHVS